MTTCHEASEEAAVALLTRHPVTPRIAVHLQECPACHAQWERLSALPDLLAAARDAEPSRQPQPGPALLERLLAEAARSRRRRRVALVAAAAAGVVVLAAPAAVWLDVDRSASPGPGGVGAGVTTSAGRPPTGVLAAGRATVQSSDVQADVEIRATAWGSDVAVSADGLTPGTVCQIVVVDRKGHSEKAGSWTVLAEYHPGTAVHETVHTAPDQISWVQLIDEASGTRLLDVPIT
jgi:hypothetical protein